MKLKLDVGGQQVEIDWRKKKVKHMHLHVQGDGKVWVSAPLSTSQNQVTAFLQQKAGWIRQHQDKIRPMDGYVLFLGEQVAAFPEYEKEAKVYLTQRFQMLCQKIGVCPALRFQVTKTRYGCCQPAKKMVTLHPGLIAAPRRCIDYVIYHELTHLFVANHSPAFHAALRQYVPDEAALRRELSRYVI